MHEDRSDGELRAHKNTGEVLNCFRPPRAHYPGDRRIYLGDGQPFHAQDRRHPRWPPYRQIRRRSVGAGRESRYPPDRPGKLSDRLWVDGSSASYPLPNAAGRFNLTQAELISTRRATSRWCRRGRAAAVSRGELQHGGGHKSCCARFPILRRAAEIRLPWTPAGVCCSSSTCAQRKRRTARRQDRLEVREAGSDAAATPTASTPRAIEPFELKVATLSGIRLRRPLPLCVL